MGECHPPAIADQENHASSPDQESVSVCDIQTTPQRHLEDKANCVEDRKLSNEQSDKFDQVGKASDTQEVTRGSGAGLDVESAVEKGAKTGAGGSGSWLRTISEGSVSGLGTKQGAGRSGSWLRTISEGSVSGLETKQGAGGSGSGQKAKYGAGQRAKSGVRGSGLVLGAKSGVGLDAESGPGKGVKTGSGGYGTWSGLRTMSEAVSSMGTKQGAGKSGSGQRTKSGLEELESGLGTHSRASGSGLGQGTKSGLEEFETGLGTNSRASGSGLGQGTKSGLEELESGLGTNSRASGSGLGQGTKSGSEGSGLNLGTKPGAEGSGAASGSRLECCPMCLMPFPAGWVKKSTKLIEQNKFHVMLQQPKMSNLVTAKKYLMHKTNNIPTFLNLALLLAAEWPEKFEQIIKLESVVNKITFVLQKFFLLHSSFHFWDGH